MSGQAGAERGTRLPRGLVPTVSHFNGKHSTGLAMRLSHQGRFAVTAMIDLALRQNTGPDHAGRNQPTAADLVVLPRAIVPRKLRRHGLVESTRRCTAAAIPLGLKAAGYLSWPVLIVSVDEPIDATRCGGKENCLGEAGRYMTHELLGLSLNQRMVGSSLDSVSCRSWSMTRSPRAVADRGTSRPSNAAISSSSRCQPDPASTPGPRCLHLGQRRLPES